MKNDIEDVAREYSRRIIALQGDVDELLATLKLVERYFKTLDIDPVNLEVYKRILNTLDNMERK